MVIYSNVAIVLHTRRAGFPVLLVSWIDSVAELAEECLIQKQRADGYVYCSSSSYRLQ